MRFFNLIELKLTNHLNLKIGGFFSRPQSKVGNVLLNALSTKRLVSASSPAVVLSQRVN
jgi:hypothetical protein